MDAEFYREARADLGAACSRARTGGDDQLGRAYVRSDPRRSRCRRHQGRDPGRRGESSTFPDAPGHERFVRACHGEPQQAKPHARHSPMDPKGATSFSRLAARSDVVVENFKVGTLTVWGLGYGAVREVKPDIVYAFSYYRLGPIWPVSSPAPGGLAPRWLQAASGFMSLNGTVSRRGPPTKAATVWDDLGGLHGARSCPAMACRSRHFATQTGEGWSPSIVDVGCLLFLSSPTDFRASPLWVSIRHGLVQPVPEFRRFSV